MLQRLTIVIFVLSLAAAGQTAAPTGAATKKPAAKMAKATNKKAAAPTAHQAILHTTMGDMKCELFPDKTPKTVENFVGLATGKKDWTDPATGKVVASFFLPVQGPGDVAFWRGQAWALTLQRAAAIVRIDPAVNRVVGAPTRLAGSAGPIASGPAGLWVIAEGLLLHLGIRGDAAAAALPAVGAPGFPASIYPPPASRKELNLAGRCPGGRHRPGPQLPLRSAPDRPGVLAAGPCQLARRNRHQALRARTRAVLGAAAVLPPGVRPAGHEPHDPGRVRPPDRRRHLDDRHRPGNAPGPESGMPATRRALPADNHQRCRRCEPWPVQSRECWSPT